MLENGGKVMSNRQDLKKHHQRLMLEGWIKAAVCGFNMGLAVCIIIAVITLLSAYKGVMLSILTGVGVFIGSTPILYFVFFRPPLKKTAERLDSTGLEQSAVTMLDYAKSETFMAQKQRADAESKISAVNPKRIGPKIFKIPCVLMMVLMAAAITVLLLPPRVEEYSAEHIAGKEEIIAQIIIDEMLKDLREAIDNARIEEELREKLHGMVDNLEKELDECETIEAKIEKIKETAKQIHEILSEFLIRKSIGEALQEYENTKELGEAVSGEGNVGASEAIENIRAKLESLTQSELKEVLEQLSQSVSGALEKAGKSEDKLFVIFENFNAALIEAANDQTNMAEKANAALDELKAALIGELESQDNIGDLDEKIKDIINNSLEAMGEEREDDGTTQDKEEEKEEEGEEEEPKPDEGDEKEEGESGADNIDKVIDGTVPYLDVYEQYYKSAMEALENGALTEEMKEYIRRYFEMLA